MVVVVNLDQSDRESIDNSVRRAVMEFGRLDILCHLGGGTSPERDRPIMELTDGAWDDTVALILTSVFLLNRAAFWQMITQGDGGAIVNLGSFRGGATGRWAAGLLGAEGRRRSVDRRCWPESSPRTGFASHGASARSPRR